MNRGILQLATTGKLPLQLGYRALEIPLEHLFAELETSEATHLSSTSFLAGSFELTYGEY